MVKNFSYMFLLIFCLLSPKMVFANKNSLPEELMRNILRQYREGVMNDTIKTSVAGYIQTISNDGLKVSNRKEVLAYYSALSDVMIESKRACDDIANASPPDLLNLYGDSLNDKTKINMWKALEKMLSKGVEQKKRKKHISAKTVNIAKKTIKSSVMKIFKSLDPKDLDQLKNLSVKEKGANFYKCHQSAMVFKNLKLLNEKEFNNFTEANNTLSEYIDQHEKRYSN